VNWGRLIAITNVTVGFCLLILETWIPGLICLGLGLVLTILLLEDPAQ